MEGGVLSAADRKRLISVLNLLSSPVTGECAAAAAAAMRIVSGAGLSWTEIIGAAEPEPCRESHSDDDWRGLAMALLQQHAAVFNNAERAFLRDVVDFPRLSPKQHTWLQRLAERARRGARAA
jgi:hypothetical protein